MKEELELELVKKYPKILQNYKGDPRQTCLSFGIETGDGWYNLLDKCMEKLQYFCDLCSKDGREVQVIAEQVKEKFSELRFYFTVYEANEVEDNIIQDIVSEAERKSRRTCEVTGDDGTSCRRGGWYMTLCRTEARKLGYVACDEETEKYWKTKDEQEINP